MMPPVEPPPNVMDDVSTPPIAPEIAPEVVAAELNISAKYFRWFAFIALLTIAIDQLAKIAVRRGIEMGAEVPLIPGWVHLSHVLNYGAAWGLLSGQRPLLIAIALVVIAAVVWVARDYASRGPRAAVGLGLILGGAVGNLIDRILLGAVTDFIDLDTQLQFLRTFPVFNVADSALTVGVILLSLDLLFDPKPPQSKPH